MSPSSARRAVVMVDDNPGDREIARICYERSSLHCPFTAFASGEDFLAYVHEACEGRAPEPALVLLDINMPRMDGFEALARFREEGRMEHVPVVILSSSRNPEDAERATALGTAFASKSSSIDEYTDFFDSLTPLPC